MLVAVANAKDSPFGVVFFTGRMEVCRLEDGTLGVRPQTSADPDDAYRFLGFREARDLLRHLRLDNFRVENLREVLC